MGRAINIDDLTTTWLSHFVGLGLVLGFLLPHTATVFLLVNPLLCLFYQLFRCNMVFYKNNLIVLIPILLSLFINFPQGVSSKSVLLCITIILYFTCFPIVGKVNVPNTYLYFILVAIVFSQLIYVLRIPFFVDLLNTYYPISEDDAQGIVHMQNTISFRNMLNYRLGGLYRNPNQCSRYLSFLMTFFILVNHKRPVQKWVLYLLISFIAILLTGSRTGFVVASVIVIFFLFENKKVPNTWRFWVLLLIAAGFAYILISGSSSFRGANLLESDSVGSKFNAFRDYLRHEDSVLRVVVGYLDPRFFESSFGILDKFDADYGYIIFQYGFIGFLCFLFFFFTLFRRVNRTGKIFFILLLWMFTSTIITSYRAVFIFIMLMSLIYNQFLDGRFSKDNIWL